MQTLTKNLIAAGVSEKVLNESILTRLLPGSPQRRYNLVNRAIGKGELVRLKRGLYVLDSKYRDSPVHPFSIAQAIEPGSYISTESALSFHQWIPEGVRMTTSISAGKKLVEINHQDYGTFSFRPIATNRGYFLELVNRLELDRQVAWVARPSRALMDMVYLRKLEWQGLEWLQSSYRIEWEQLRSITGAEIRTLRLIYKNKRVITFLNKLSGELGND